MSLGLCRTTPRRPNRRGGGGTVWLILALGISLFLASTLSHAASRKASALDENWRFQRSDVPGAQNSSFDDSGWQAVRLPHTWNALDGEAGGAYYRGPAWYRRDITLPRLAAARSRFIEFDGAALSADVWVNGELAGRHRGGYARFRVDVSHLLHAGHNSLAVRVDNTHQDTIAPLGGDFTIFGGLYRSVRLLDVSDMHIDLSDHGGPGVQMVLQSLTPDLARLRVTTRISNQRAHAQALDLQLSLHDAEGHVVLRQTQRLHATALATKSQSILLELKQPKRWQGVHNPYLYRLSAELKQGGRVVDEVELPLGLRTVAIDPQRGLLLNGQPYALRGVNYFHAGRPSQGLAVTDAAIDEDMAMLKEMGVTGLRLVHFQHPQRTYELADRLGLLLWTEIPLNSTMHESKAFRANLAQQLQELIRQNHHHVSVAIWGLGNEVYRADAGSHVLLGEMHALAKREDASRPTAYAHCCAADDDPLSLQTDVTGYNRYYGWYDREFSDIGPWADHVHALLPGRAIGLSEYGAGANALQQQDPPQRPSPTGAWHPEQYQALFHESYWRQIESRPWLWGNFVWVGFDLASAWRNEGSTPGLNDKGLISYDRQVRKDAYFWYQANWSRTPMAYISSRRFTPRPAGSTTIKVYTNAAVATLKLDGIDMGTVKVEGRQALWPAVQLAPGKHQLSVSTDQGASDAVVWECSP